MEFEFWGMTYASSKHVKSNKEYFAALRCSQRQSDLLPFIIVGLLLTNFICLP